MSDDWWSMATKSHRSLHGLCLPLVATSCIFLATTKIQRSAKPIKIEGGGKEKTEDEMMQRGADRQKKPVHPGEISVAEAFSW